MLLQPFRQGNVVEVVEAIHRVSESFVVFLLHQHVVVSVIDGFDVELKALHEHTAASGSRRLETHMLHSNEIRPNER